MIILTIAAAATALAASPAETVGTGGDLSEARIQEVIQKFAEKETEFSKVRQMYTYRQSAKLQEYSDDGSPGGKWEIVTDVIFSSDGKRSEKVVLAGSGRDAQAHLDGSGR